MDLLLRPLHFSILTMLYIYFCLCGAYTPVHFEMGLVSMPGTGYARGAFYFFMDQSGMHGL